MHFHYITLFSIPFSILYYHSHPSAFFSTDYRYQVFDSTYPDYHQHVSMLLYLTEIYGFLLCQATRISDELMAAMEENIYLTEFHEKKGNAKKLLELDNRFHELLYEAGGSKELMRVLKDYHEYVGRVRKVTLGETKRAKNSTHEHKQICEAIKNHDALLAEKCAREHINNSKENMEHLGWENLIK